jgi:hypothetical protein
MSTVFGNINMNCEKPQRIIKELRQIYSNSIMGFSGLLKTQNINIYNNVSNAIEAFIYQMQIGIQLHLLWIC